MVNDILADASAIRGGTLKSIESRMSEDLITEIWDEVVSNIYESAAHNLFQTMIEKSTISKLIKDDKITVNFICDYIKESVLWLNYKVSITDDVIIIDW